MSAPRAVKRNMNFSKSHSRSSLAKNGESNLIKSQGVRLDDFNRFNMMGGSQASKDFDAVANKPALKDILIAEDAQGNKTQSAPTVTAAEVDTAVGRFTQRKAFIKEKRSQRGRKATILGRNKSPLGGF